MKIKIKDQEFELKYTIESWKKLKSQGDITPMNIQEKLNADFASCMSSIILYGLSPEDRSKTNIEEIDSVFGFDVIDIILPAIMENMPKSVKDQSEGGATKK